MIKSASSLVSYQKFSKALENTAFKMQLLQLSSSRGYFTDGDREDSDRFEIIKNLIESEISKSKITILQALGEDAITKDHITGDDLANAASLGDLGILKLMFAKGASVHLKDKYGNLSFTGDYLAKAASLGDVDLLNLILTNGIDVNLKDTEGRTPLFYAKNKETIDCLMKHKADPFQKHDRVDVLSYMRMNKKAPSVIQHLKKYIAFDKATVESFSLNMRAILTQELKIAKEQGKQLLIMLGETHESYRCYKAEKILLQIARELGINVVLDELDETGVKNVLKPDLEHLTSCIYSVKLLRKAKNKRRMTIEGVDKYQNIGLASLKRRGDAEIDLRNMGIREETLKQTKDAVLIVGSHHMEGLLEDEITSLSEKNDAPKKYRVIPLNFSSIVNTKKDYQITENHTREEFVYNKDNVIQVDPFLKFSASEARKVINRWNIESSQLDIQREDGRTFRQKIEEEIARRIFI